MGPVRPGLGHVHQRFSVVPSARGGVDDAKPGEQCSQQLHVTCLNKPYLSPLASVRPVMGYLLSWSVSGVTPFSSDFWPVNIAALAEGWWDTVGSLLSLVFNSFMLDSCRIGDER